jgi:uncharacterized protein (TIGR02147 family)
VTTGPGPLGHHVVNYHRVMIEQAARALDDVPREQRDISSLTLCVGQEGFERIRQRIADFRQELLQIAELGERADRIVQIGFQLFPLSTQSKGAQ